MSDNLETLITLNDQYSHKIAQATNATKSLVIAQSLMHGSTKKVGTGASEAGDSVSSFGSSAMGAFSSIRTGVPILEGVLTGLQAIGIAAGAAAAAMIALSAYASRQAASFEQLTLGLQVFAGSAAETERQLNRLREVAKLPGLSFRDAVEGSTKLQAVGFSAALAERALMAFGNALAMAGKGKEDLQGIIVALSQIVSKGIVSAEEINQIAERMPQIRVAMQEAFGTANTETLQKMGITSEVFITKLIGVVEAWKKVQGGTQNAFDNLSDSVDRIAVSFGQAINKMLGPAAQALGDALNNAVNSGVVSQLGNALTKAIDGASQLFGASGLPDLLVKGAALTMAILENIPSVIQGAVNMFKSLMASVGQFFDGILASINSVLMGLRKIAIPPTPWTDAFMPFAGVQPIEGFKGNIMDAAGLAMNASGNPVAGSLGGAVLDTSKRYKDIYGQIKGGDGSTGFKPEEGGFTTSFGASERKIIDPLQQIERNTRPMDKVAQLLLGGGTNTNAAFNQVNLSGWTSSGKSGGDKLSKAVNLIREAIHEEMFGAAKHGHFSPKSF